MSFTLGRNVKMTVSGASHSEYIEVKIEGLPKGAHINRFLIEEFLRRRQGGGNFYSTPRKEADVPDIINGLDGEILTGDPLIARFYNSNVRKNDYANLKVVPRPSHADFVAYMKYEGKMDMSGGGFFSGRMTLPMCFAGAVCKQLLEEAGILIGAHIASIGDVEDDRYDSIDDMLEENIPEGLAVLNPQKAEEMLELMKEVASDGDSIGGTIECKVVGLPVGVGDPIYDSLESMISFGMFGIPAIKGIEFGRGFDISKTRGSESNDPFIINEGQVKCRTNNSGGIQGGISNGMPLIFKVAVKPTPSISKPQDSVDLVSMTPTVLEIKGRHDSCIVPRVVPCIEAMCALILYDAVNLDVKND